MGRKTRADKAKEAATEALGKAKHVASDLADSASGSDLATRAAEAARAAESTLMAKAHEAAAMAEEARGRRRQKAAKAHAEATLSEAMTARQELEQRLIESARDAASTAKAAAEKTAKSPTGRRTRRATKAALKDAKAAAKAQKKARNSHPFRNLLVLVVAGGAAAVAASDRPPRAADGEVRRITGAVRVRQPAVGGGPGPGGYDQRCDAPGEDEGLIRSWSSGRQGLGRPKDGRALFRPFRLNVDHLGPRTGNSCVWARSSTDIRDYWNPWSRIAPPTSRSSVSSP